MPSFILTEKSLWTSKYDKFLGVNKYPGLTQTKFQTMKNNNHRLKNLYLSTKMFFMLF